MREIPLTKGRVALVDDADYERIAFYRWHCTSNGYAARTTRVGDVVTQSYVLMHREVLGFPPEPHIDHADGDKLNNCRANLRACSASQNQGNAPKRKRHGVSASPYKGVTWQRSVGRWQASIYVDGRQVSLGLYGHESDAALAYDRAARERWGSFARLNFPDVAA